ncbi:MAG: Minf_1886 family protein [Planctomycetota bacterium]
MATPTLDPAHPLAELLRRDQRFDFDAYVFVFDALRYAQEQLHLGQPTPSRDAEPEPRPSPVDSDSTDNEAVEQHVTGQELCEAMRLYSLDQYGMLAKCVLNHWGVRSTGDFGEIVFNLIEIGQMRKTDRDRREDFDEVFSFDTLVDKQVFSLAEAAEDG